MDHMVGAENYTGGSKHHEMFWNERNGFVDFVDDEGDDDGDGGPNAPPRHLALRCRAVALWIVGTLCTWDVVVVVAAAHETKKCPTAAPTEYRWNRHPKWT